MKKNNENIKKNTDSKLDEEIANKKKSLNLNNLKTKFIIATTATLFLSTLISNVIYNLIERFININPKFAVFISTLINIGIIALFAYILVSKVIMKHLKNIFANVDKIAQGDLTQIKEIANKDEFGAINSSLNKITSNIKNMVKDIKSNSEVLAENTRNLSQIVEETTEAVENIANNVNDIATGSEDTSKNIIDLNEAISNLANLSQNTEKNTQTASELSENMAKAAQQGSLDMDKIIDKVNLIDDSTKTTSGIIEDLNNRIKDINNIVVIINEISEQTNLLALNAAIEAARAGEYGKGFAVVAEEIRKLADATHTYSEEISNITNSVIKSSQDAVKSSEKVNDVVNESVQVADLTKTSFGELLKKIEKIDSLIAEIAKSSKEERNNSQYILEKATEISAISEETTAASESSAAATEKNLASMEEITASIENLSQIADKLNNMVESFKL